VKKHSYWAYRGQQRLNLCLLVRHLVLSNRARLKTKEEIDILSKKMMAINIDTVVETNKTTIPQKKQKSIPEILNEYKLYDKCFARSLRLLEVFELNDLRPVDKSMIVQLDLSSKERRQLWNMIKEEKERLPAIKNDDGDDKKKVKKKLSRKEKKLIQEEERKQQEKQILKDKQAAAYINSLKILSNPDLPLLAVNVILRFIY
jgi:hypothetical protein